MNFCNPAAAASGPAPPPSSAPPVPPPESVNLDEFSYHNNSDYNGYGSNDSSSSSSSRPGMKQKMYEDYGLAVSNSGRVVPGNGKNNSSDGRSSNSNNNNNNSNGGSNLPSMRGDATLQPNTGNSNQSAGTVLGSLQEITSFLRWTTIASTVAAIVWEGFAFPTRLMIGSALTHPAQVVLGAYLGFFCVLILGAELNNAHLRDNFGFLYDPLSRGFVLLMMSGMSIGILQSWWESLLGLAFFVVGFGYIYTFVKYPEYRRWQNHNERGLSTAWQEAKMYWLIGGGDDDDDTAVATATAMAAWAAADPRSALTPTQQQAGVGIGQQQTASETRSLLHHRV